MSEARFRYKPRFVFFSLSTLFFGGFGWACAYFAQTNDRGAILNGVLELSAATLSMISWSLVAVSGLVILFNVCCLCVGFTTKREVVVTESGIVAPKSGASRQLVSVGFADISNVQMVSVQKQRFLTIHHPGGKLTIPQNMLANRQAFDELTAAVAANVSG